jgi:hypothetical protein
MFCSNNDCCFTMRMLPHYLCLLSLFPQHLLSMALCSESAIFLSSATLCLTLLWVLPIDVCVLYGLHLQCLQRIFIIISDDTFTSDVNISNMVYVLVIVITNIIVMHTKGRQSYGMF